MNPKFDSLTLFRFRTPYIHNFFFDLNQLENRIEITHIYYICKKNRQRTKTIE